jgi:hypothetical protein
MKRKTTQARRKVAPSRPARQGQQIGTPLEPGSLFYKLSPSERVRVFALAKCLSSAGDRLLVAGIYGIMEPGEIVPLGGAGEWIDRFSERCRTMLDDLSACKWPTGTLLDFQAAFLPERGIA